MKSPFSFIPDTIPAGMEQQIKSIPEEKANIVSHAIGWLFFVLALPVLWIAKVVEKQDVFLQWGIFLFGLGLVLVYTSSTWYHCVFEHQLRKKVRVFDHISIYFLIAGSFTPFLLFFLRQKQGWPMFLLLYGLVILGSIFKYFFTEKFRLISTLAYVAMGGLVYFIFDPLAASISPLALNCIKLGGVFYGVGTIFYLWKQLKYNHFIWHVFVLGGSISHFMAVWLSL